MRTKLLLLALLSSPLFAQQEFPKVWEGKYSVDADYKGVSDDLAYLVGGDLTEIEMMDGTTGKSLWTYNFKEKNDVRKCESWEMHDETGTVEVTLDKGKKEGTEVFHLDYKTGAVVSSTTLAARPKEKHKHTSKNKRVNQGGCYDEASQTLVQLAYDKKTIMSAKKGTDLDLTVEASGGHAWTTPFTARVVRHLTNDRLPAADGQVLLRIGCSHGKVFVIYEGITCLDLATGKILWNTTFDNVQTSIGLKVKQEIGRAAFPLVADDGVYLCDFSKDARTIKKLDINTGAVIWQAEKLKKDDVVSELVVDGGNLIARFGGLIRVEEYIPGMDGNPDVYKVNYEFEGSTSLRAYNAATGAPAWSTAEMEFEDNFKKSECNILSNGGKVYACGEKSMYIFDAASGKLLQQGEYTAKAIGKASKLASLENSFLVLGEKGITRLGSDLKPQYATNTGKCLMTEVYGDSYIVWTGKDYDDMKEFGLFDLATGKITGTLEDCRYPHFNPAGDRFVRFDGQKAMLYKTN